MAILKRKRPVRKNQPSDLHNFEDISSPQDLIRFARVNNIETCPMDTRSLIKALGIGISSYPMEDQKSGYLKNEEGRWVIGINSMHHPKRQRFTMAHELGHYFLHKDTEGDLEDTILFRSTGYGDKGIESEANKFAAELLMPEDMFRELVRTEAGLIEAVSDRMGVSALAVTYRAKDLGYKERP